MRRCCSELRLSVWRTGKASQIFYCFAESKVLLSTDLVLRSFFFFKSMECVCGHKNKNVSGEVHRWRGRWVQRLACGNKNNPTELHGLPPVARTLLNVKDSLKMCFRAETCLTTLDLDIESEWGKLVNV